MPAGHPPAPPVLLIDINIVLDLLLDRAPWSLDAALLLSAVETKKAFGYVAAHTITTAHYVIERTKGGPAAAVGVSDLLRIVEVAPIEKSDLQQALALGFADFEDAVEAVCALKVAANYIVTRNESDFATLSIPAVPPAVVLALLKRIEEEGVK